LTASAVHRLIAFLQTSSLAKVEETKKMETKKIKPRTMNRLECRLFKIFIIDLLVL
jgi:hypothetical protein